MLETIHLEGVDSRRMCGMFSSSLRSHQPMALQPCTCIRTVANALWRVWMLQVQVQFGVEQVPTFSHSG